MFFTLSKIAAPLLAPLNICFLLMAAGIGAGIFSRRAGRGLLVRAFLMFVALGVIPLGPALLAGLENRIEATSPLPDRVDGILVLGGSFMTQISEARPGEIALNDSAERITATLALARRYPDAVIIFSGGNGHLGGGLRTEADDTAAFLESVGFDDGNVLYEDMSRNTYENILFTGELIMPQPDEIWLLVTSAHHMPRALAVASHAGWSGMVPYPVDYRTTGHGGWLPGGLDIRANFTALEIAMHEYLGIFAYHLTGKIALPLP